MPTLPSDTHTHPHTAETRARVTGEVTLIDCTYIQPSAHAHIQKKHTHTIMYIHNNTHTYAHTLLHTCTNTHTHTNSHTHRQIESDRQTHTHTHNGKVLVQFCCNSKTLFSYLQLDSKAQWNHVLDI